MATWILEGTNCTGKQIHDVLLFPSCLFFINKRTRARPERFPHQRNANLFLGHPRESTNANLHFFKPYKGDVDAYIAQSIDARKHFAISSPVRLHAQ